MNVNHDLRFVAVIISGTLSLLTFPDQILFERIEVPY